MKETKKIEQKNGVTHITVIQDFRPQIGDKVKFMIVEKGVMKMVEGIITNIGKSYHGNDEASISYEGKTYLRTFEQFEKVE